jgi:hypothetical protein
LVFASVQHAKDIDGSELESELQSSGEPIHQQRQIPATNGAEGQNTGARAPDVLFASAYGVKADGVTSDDLALTSAVVACGAIGGRLILPPGRIVLTGAAGRPIPIRDCAILGQGSLAGSHGDSASWGTTVFLESTTVQPFEIGSNWSWTGTNFYWPKQTTGRTAYPALFSDAGGNSFTSDWYLDHVNIVNAYDAVLQRAGKGSWGRFYISHSSIYAVHAAFTLSRIGDSAYIDTVNFTPGPWFSICFTTRDCDYNAYNAVNAADQVNSIFFYNGRSAQLYVSNSAAEAWRYGFYLTSDAFSGLNDVKMDFDGVGTIIDTSSGGIWAPQNLVSGFTGACNIAVYNGKSVSNEPCFNFGTNGTLRLVNFYGSSYGSFIVSSGASVELYNSVIDGVGNVADGGTYYDIQFTDTRGGTTLVVQNSRLGGNVVSGQADAHTHGIVAGTWSSSNRTIPHAVIQNNHFQYLNGAIKIKQGATTIITGNWSNGSYPGTVDTQFTGSAPIIDRDNQWANPPYQR